jgi:uncharacterized membrane protein
MKTHHFLNQVDHDRLDRAIRSAEGKTSGRIVVYISHHQVKDAVAEARHLFKKLHLETERSRAGLLLFIAPKAQKFSVVGGTALHEKLGQPGWDRLAGTLGGHFRQGRFTEGLLATIAEAGGLFQTHFPSHQPTRAARSDIIEK